LPAKQQYDLENRGDFMEINNELDRLLAGRKDDEALRIILDGLVLLIV
jgi:hypothetical protein